MIKYKLIDNFDTVISLSEMNDKRVYKSFRIEPGILYTLAEEDECERVVNTMKNFVIKFAAHKEDDLTKRGIPFEKKVCPSCGGRVIKLEVKPIEVIENV